MSKSVRFECPACHKVFSSVGAFDFYLVCLHCLTTTGMLAEGLIRNGKGWWCFDPTRSNRASRADLAARYGLAQQKAG